MIIYKYSNEYSNKICYTVNNLLLLNRTRMGLNYEDLFVVGLFKSNQHHTVIVKSRLDKNWMRTNKIESESFLLIIQLYSIVKIEAKVFFYSSNLIKITTNNILFSIFVSILHEIVFIV